MKESNDTGKLMGAILIGAAIGGILGVLFAPDKGSETRKKLMGKVKDSAESLKSKMQCEYNHAHSGKEEKVSS